MLIKCIPKDSSMYRWLDKSLEAADYSISIAKNMNAQVIVLNVLETEPWY